MTVKGEAPAPDVAEGLDLGLAALFAGFALADEVRRELAAGGFDDVRFAHGFVLQHVVPGALGISELAGRMGVSQQAASKAVAELETLGYLERVADPGDRRRRAVGLSARGRAVVEAGRTARAAQQERLEAALGPRRVAAARRLLFDVLELAGGADAVRARRVRLPS